MILKLGMQHWGLKLYKVCINSDPGLMTYFTVGSNLVSQIGKSEIGGSSESIAACDLKVGRCRQLVELIELCEFRRSRPFLDLGPR